MKAFLMYPHRDWDLQETLPPNASALIQDLELNTLFNAMALGDKFLWAVAKKAVLSSLNDRNVILYRQNILRDCLKNVAIVQEIYDIAVAAIEGEKKVYFGIFSQYPSAILRRSIDVLRLFVDLLTKLKTIAEEHASKFASEGFTAFFAMLNQELAEEYFARVQNHLHELQFHHGVLMSGELGKGNKGTHYILRRTPSGKKPSWIQRIAAKKPPVYSFTIPDRDEGGARALSELKDNGINLVANALAQSTDHMLGFFTMLRTELAFYIGCLNLHGQLIQKGEPTSFPLPAALSERRHSFQGLYDVCLALSLEQKIVSNDIHADNKDLVIVTGANQGGKSTFLRSIGLSQLHKGPAKNPIKSTLSLDDSNHI